MMIGIECTSTAIALSATRALLEAGFVVLPSGDTGQVVSLTPPLTIGEKALDAACDAIVVRLEALSTETGHTP